MTVLTSCLQLKTELQDFDFVIAVDPGSVSGAAAIFMLGAFQNAFAFSSRPDWMETLSNWINQAHAQSSVAVVVENVHTFSGQGVKSSGEFMKNLGRIEGISYAIGAPVYYVDPQDWQNSIKLPRHREILDSKKRRTARRKSQKEFALETYPQLARIKGDIFGAVLIGHAALGLAKC